MALFPRATKPSFGTLAPEDAARCAALHGEAFALGWSELEFERLLAAGTSFSDAARDGKDQVGFVLSRAAADEAEVLTMVFASRWRGRALGRALLERHIQRLAQHRLRTLFLEVNEDNAAARALYVRAGFVEIGRRPAYYAAPGGRSDALMMRRSID